jgi:hypothetical protein
MTAVPCLVQPFSWPGVIGRILYSLSSRIETVIGIQPDYKEYVIDKKAMDASVEIGAHGKLEGGAAAQLFVQVGRDAGANRRVRLG